MQAIHGPEMNLYVNQELRLIKYGFKFSKRLEKN